MKVGYLNVPIFLKTQTIPLEKVYKMAIRNNCIALILADEA